MSDTADMMRDCFNEQRGATILIDGAHGTGKTSVLADLVEAYPFNKLAILTRPSESMWSRPPLSSTPCITITMPAPGQLITAIAAAAAIASTPSLIVIDDVQNVTPVFEWVDHMRRDIQNRGDDCCLRMTLVVAGFLSARDLRRASTVADVAGSLILDGETTTFSPTKNRFAPNRPYTFNLRDRALRSAQRSA